MKPCLRRLRFIPALMAFFAIGALISLFALRSPLSSRSPRPPSFNSALLPIRGCRRFTSALCALFSLSSLYSRSRRRISPCFDVFAFTAVPFISHSASIPSSTVVFVVFSVVSSSTLSPLSFIIRRSSSSSLFAPCLCHSRSFRHSSSSFAFVVRPRRSHCYRFTRGDCVVFLGISCILHREMVLFGDTCLRYMFAFCILEFGIWNLDFWISTHLSSQELGT
jgi:hypothetical protein